jgi:type I restriction enzyme S subunit
VNEPRITEASAFITESALSNSSAKWVPKGALLIALAGQGKTKGTVAQLDFEATCNQSMAAIMPSEKVGGRFLYWWLTSNYQNIRNMAGGDLRDGLNLELIGNIPCPLPPLNEQEIIGAFLDRETTIMDALIAEQQRLIELLKEKRQAVISCAVTKGLNSDAPLKDSGIESLGQVPAHWQVLPIKHAFEFLDGRRIPLSAEQRSYRQGRYPYYGASGVIDFVDEYLFNEDLVLVSEDGANLINRATPIAFVARGMYWVNNHAHILKSSDKFLVYWSERIEAIDVAPFVTGSAQPKLTVGALGNLLIAVPPTEEERERIEAYIVKQASQIDLLVAEAEMTVTLLKERRSAVISAAVTGKIDVRGLATPPRAKEAVVSAAAQ